MSEITPENIANFDQLGLAKTIVDAVKLAGYTKPSPIQAKAIPAILTGRDLMAAAQTGTGKTAGFTLPMLELLSKGKPARANQVRALILTPTRELAAQVGESVEKYGSQLSLKSAIVFGGVKINPQMLKLTRGVDILVATPGRLMDLHQQNAVKFDDLEIFVLDEADRMLDMGFIRDIRKIINLLPKQRQNLLFSATFSTEIRELAKGLINDPIEVSVSPANTTTKLIEQWLHEVDKSAKSKMLIKLIQQNDWQQALVFTRTKHGANRLARKLDQEFISAAAIHGDKSQGARTKALANFKSGEIKILVATDIAARGIDISELPQVVNFDLPHVAEDYVHRIGRTGRAGSTGKAISLVSEDEFKQLQAVESFIGQIIERREVSGYKANNPVPESRLKSYKAPKPKKPKKPKTNTSGEQAEASQANNKPKADSRGQARRKPNSGSANKTRKPRNPDASGNKPSNQNSDRPQKKRESNKPNKGNSFKFKATR